jgi:hypothetical protein
MSKKEQQDQFEWWITCIPDKIEFLKKNIPLEVATKLDSTIESMDYLESYLLQYYSIEKLNK